jgi:eukaryotic-like serine/threonine-protein kinase
VPASRAPWWLYIIAASFLGFFGLQVYAYVWGTEDIGFTPYSLDSMIMQEVSPNGAGARAGLRAGDRIIGADGIPLDAKAGWPAWNAAYANFEIGRTIPLKVEREGKQIELALNLRPGSPKDLPWTDWQLLCGEVFTLILAFVVVFRRPHDPIAQMGALFLASLVFGMLAMGPGWAATWRRLPAPLGLLLWPGEITRTLTGGLCVTFCAIFPRPLFRSRWLWLLIWMPGSLIAVLQCLLYIRLVYQPAAMPGSLDMLRPDFTGAASALFFYVPACLLVWVLQYRRLEDLNDRRRMRVLLVGALLCGLAVMANIAINLLIPTPVAAAIYNTAVIPAVLIALYLAGPISFAYAVLRHRVLDLGLILRRGLQYALARRVLISAVPALGAIFLADLMLHANQPILTVFRSRGWMYATLAAMALLGYARQRSWLESLDRRFFREQYDARRLLREVVEEVRATRSFEQEASSVVTRVEAALHPEFAALVACEPDDVFYRTIAAAPSEKIPPLRKDGKLISLMRLLGKPLVVPQTESGWLQEQLPHEETEFLRRARIDLLIPIATDPQRTQALLALGVKRSEEPYSGEDTDLLVAIAASLAILLERPSVSSVPRRDIFEECPKCGVCYDSGATECLQEGARLVPVILPRLLQERYRLERRLGRGGIGTVYSASDISLERRVAVKVIREDLVGSAEAAERFRREARAAASFAHPNIVTVYDFGVASGTRAFLVMEILEGSTLRETLQIEKRLPTSRALPILRDVCGALSAAHRGHLVHRDLKPENIFLVAINSGGIAKVLDFGVAKFLSNSTQQPTVDTAAGAVLGTPRYMSPEQRRGEEAHCAWDLWALAVVTYEMLTGAFPFGDRSSDDWLMAGPTLPFTPVAHYIPDAGKRWQELFEHGFAREISCRHTSVEAFLSELNGAAS